MNYPTRLMNLISKLWIPSATVLVSLIKS